MSGKPVPLTVVKGAGFEHIPFAAANSSSTLAGLPHITADFHSIRTKTDSPAYITSGFYKVEAGPALNANYGFEEAKYVLQGQIDVFVSVFLSCSTQFIPPWMAGNGLIKGPQCTDCDASGRGYGRNAPLGPWRLCFFPCWHQSTVLHQIFWVRFLHRYSACPRRPP